MPLAHLFVDLNSYFASVEQQLSPELRGKAIAVGPGDINTGTCIAVSYEGKRFGVKTGTKVGEARRLCPQMIFVSPRFSEYIKFHHAILAAAETVLPIHGVHSIDEFSCRLGKGQREPEQATELALRVKRAIYERVGECLKCSIGIAPNRFLAKVGTEMQKPDGLIVIRSEDLPHILFSLGLRDLPGIGAKMHERLQKRGIHSVEQLCALSERDLGGAWESVIGKRWHRLLRGDELEEEPSHRRSISHQHVLGPKSRNDTDARAVAMRLLHKAASRARHLGYLTRRLTLALQFYRGSGKEKWHISASIRGGESDTLALVSSLAKLWDQKPPGAPFFVSVVLDELVSAENATAPLFGEERNRRDLASAIDKLDAKYGRLTVYSAAMHKAKDRHVGGIAWGHIPEQELPDSVANDDEA